MQTHYSTTSDQKRSVATWCPDSPNLGIDRWCAVTPISGGVGMITCGVEPPSCSLPSQSTISLPKLEIYLLMAFLSFSYPCSSLWLSLELEGVDNFKKLFLHWWFGPNLLSWAQKISIGKGAQEENSWHWPSPWGSPEWAGLTRAMTSSASISNLHSSRLFLVNQSQIGSRYLNWSYMMSP